MSKKTLMIVTAITIAILIAANVMKTTEPSVASKQTGQAFFTGLIDKVNTVNLIKIESKSEQTQLKKLDDNTWVVASKDDYPAALADIRKLLVGSAKLIKIEPKTSNPKRYGKLGLTEVDGTESKAIAVSLFNDKTQIAAYVLGNRGNGSVETMYILDREDPQSWLVKGYVTVNDSPLDWLQKTLVDIDEKRIHKVIVEPKEGESFYIYKKDLDGTSFQLADLPKNKEIDSAFSVNNIANSFAKIKLRDVQLAADEELDKILNYSATLETFDGLRIKMLVAKRNDKFLAKLVAHFDDTIIKLPQPEKNVTEKDSPTDTKNTAKDPAKPAEDPAEQEKEKERKQQQAQAEFEKKQLARKTKIAQAKEEAKKYTAKWAKWLYVLPDQVASSIGKQKQDLYKKPEEKAEEKPNE